MGYTGGSGHIAGLLSVLSRTEGKGKITEWRHCDSNLTKGKWHIRRKPSIEAIIAVCGNNLDEQEGFWLLLVFILNSEVDIVLYTTTSFGLYGLTIVKMWSLLGLKKL